MAADVFNCKWILNVIAVFGACGNVCRGLAGKQRDITGKQNHARAFVCGALDVPLWVRARRCNQTGKEE